LKLNNIGVDEAILNIVPYLFRVDSFNDDPSYGTIDENGNFTYPPLSNLGFNTLQDGSVFLMDAGEYLYLFLNPK
jgi:hypothetical protein